MESKLKIIEENEEYLIIDKQAGITVNRSDTTENEITMQDLIDREHKINTNDEDQEFIQRSGTVHRLDKETSGLLIVAKNSYSFRALQKQFKERRVEKSYIALAHGQIIPNIGEISVPVGRLPWNRKRFGVLAGGRESLTSYEVVSNFQFSQALQSEKGKGVSNKILSLVRLFPKTGRTHQIRVHLKYINHPIFGDPLYGGRKTSKQDRVFLPRVFLHAESISFFDPKTEEKVSYRSELSKDLKELLEKLESKTDNN